MLTLDHPAVHKFVREQRRLGNNVRWDGWELVFFSPTHHGYTNPKGAFLNNRWGMETRVSVDTDGMWRISNKNVRRQSA